MKNTIVPGVASTAGKDTQAVRSSKDWRAERVALSEVVANYSFKTLRLLINKEKRQMEIGGSGFQEGVERPARKSEYAEAKLLAVAENTRRICWP